VCIAKTYSSYCHIDYCYCVRTIGHAVKNAYPKATQIEYQPYRKSFWPQTVFRFVPIIHCALYEYECTAYCFPWSYVLLGPPRPLVYTCNGSRPGGPQRPHCLVPSTGSACDNRPAFCFCFCADRHSTTALCRYGDRVLCTGCTQCAVRNNTHGALRPYYRHYSARRQPHKTVGSLWLCGLLRSPRCSLRSSWSLSRSPRCALRSSWCLLDPPCALRSLWCPS
jgi:hypothetical protein